MAWLINILDQIQRPELLDAAEVARDDLCELGQWINGLAAEYGEVPEYIDLKARHTELHRCASEAVSLAQKGKLSESRQCLSMEGKCIENSKNMLASYNRLIKKINLQ